MSREVKSPAPRRIETSPDGRRAEEGDDMYDGGSSHGQLLAYPQLRPFPRLQQDKADIVMTCE